MWLKSTWFLALLGVLLAGCEPAWKSINGEADRLYEAGDYRSAIALYEEAVAVATRAYGADSFTVAELNNSLALAYRAQGELIKARDLQAQVVERMHALRGEENLHTLITMRVLASIKKSLGDLAGARELDERVLATSRRILDPEHPKLLTAMGNLADTLREQGEVARARAFEEEVLEVRKRTLGPEAADTLIAMSNLAITLETQGDLAAARELKEKALAAQRRLLGDEHPNTLTTINNLAVNLQLLGELAAARELLEELVAVRRRTVGPENPETLKAMVNLASNFVDEGNPEAARELYEEVLATSRERFGAAHRFTLHVMHNLAEPLYQLGELAEAERLYDEVVETRRRLGIREHRADALSFYRLALVHRDAGEPEEASRYFSRALDSLERQALTIDFSEDVKSLFRSWNSRYYRDAIANSLTLGRPHEALHTSERFRAQGLLSLLVSDHRASARIPVDLEAQRREIALRYDAVYAELDRLQQGAADDSERVAVLRDEQAELRRRRQVLDAEIREAVLGADWQPPRPLALAEIRQALDPGTLLLSYSVNDDESVLFVLSPGGELEAHELPVGAKVLEDQVGNFKRQLTGGPSLPEPAQRRLGEWLYDNLLAAAADRIAASDRLLLLPDGPLYELPFAALTRRTAAGDRQYLIEWKPLHTAASATVYAELRQRRDERAPPPLELVAFGDPVYPGEDAGGAALPWVVRSAIERGAIDRFGRLANATRELRQIGELFPQETVRLHVREQASEAAAKALAGSARIVHFATHGLYDSEVPLDSFLALSLPAGGGEASREPATDNGFLQAWEISQELRLRADLVVLSACDTAVGEYRNGEGLLSLSRAFLIAGARSVVASLWSVEDLSTSELMIRFYRRLAEGESTESALRAAQVELLRGPIEVADGSGESAVHDFTAPYHWAAFQLIGDWR